MHHIMYVSTATILVSEDDLRQMLFHYRRKNQQDAITGLLLYSGEHYVQLIEGAEKDLRRLFVKIAQDPLHRNLIKLADGKINARLFSDWTMGFEVISAEAFALFEGYVNPTKSNFLNSWPEREEDSPIAILRQFARHHLTGSNHL